DLILSDPLALHRFKQFTSRTACNENLLFWCAAEEYRYIPSSSYLKLIANKIVNTYIRNAKLEVNLPGHVYKEIQDELSSGHVTKKLFLSAQKVIWRLMHADTFPRFLVSPEYRSVSGIENYQEWV